MPATNAPQIAVKNAQTMGLTRGDAEIAVSVANRIEQALPAETRADVNLSLGQLPEAVRAGIVREFAAPVPAVQDATPAAVEAFGETDAGALALATWGHDATRKVALVKARWNRAIGCRIRVGLAFFGRRCREKTLFYGVQKLHARRRA